MVKYTKMGKITEVKLNFGYTRNMGNYESMRVDVEFRSEVGENENPLAVTAELEKMAKAEVRRIITGKVENKDDMEDFY